MNYRVEMKVAVKDENSILGVDNYTDHDLKETIRDMIHDGEAIAIEEIHVEVIYE